MYDNDVIRMTDVLVSVRTPLLLLLRLLIRHRPSHSLQFLSPLSLQLMLRTFPGTFLALPTHFTFARDGYASASANQRESVANLSAGDHQGSSGFDVSVRQS